MLTLAKSFKAIQGSRESDLPDPGHPPCTVMCSRCLSPSLIIGLLVVVPLRPMTSLSCCQYQLVCHPAAQHCSGSATSSGEMSQVARLLEKQASDAPPRRKVSAGIRLTQHPGLGSQTNSDRLGGAHCFQLPQRRSPGGSIHLSSDARSSQGTAFTRDSKTGCHGDSSPDPPRSQQPKQAPGLVAPTGLPADNPSPGTQGARTWGTLAEHETGSHQGCWAS